MTQTSAESSLRFQYLNQKTKQLATFAMPNVCFWHKADMARITSRFGGLPSFIPLNDTFECRACGVSHIEAA
jgi:hypothetical protein